MARWSDATLKQLGGFDKNVVIDEILYGEDNTYPIQFFTASGRTVAMVSGAIVTFTGGDNTVFTVGRTVSFADSSQTYIISAIGTNTITLTTTPTETIAVGSSIQTTLNLSGYSFSFRLLEHVTSGITENSKGVIDLGILSPKQGATQKNLDSQVLQTNLLDGLITVLLNDSNLDDTPVIDSLTPPIYTGFVAYTAPAAGSVPAQTKKQRVCWVLRSDGAVDGTG